MFLAFGLVGAMIFALSVTLLRLFILCGCLTALSSRLRTGAQGRSRCAIGSDYRLDATDCECGEPDEAP